MPILFITFAPVILRMAGRVLPVDKSVDWPIIIRKTFARRFLLTFRNVGNFISVQMKTAVGVYPSCIFTLWYKCTLFIRMERVHLMPYGLIYTQWRRHLLLLFLDAEVSSYVPERQGYGWQYDSCAFSLYSCDRSVS